MNKILLPFVVTVAIFLSCEPSETKQLRRDISGTYELKNFILSQDTLEPLMPTKLRLELDRCSLNKMSIGNCEAVLTMNDKEVQSLFYKLIYIVSPIEESISITFEYPSDMKDPTLKFSGNSQVEYLTEEEMELTSSIIFNNPGKTYSSSAILTFIKEN